jgi:hypothetical protein
MGMAISRVLPLAATSLAQLSLVVAQTDQTMMFSLYLWMVM